ncbi:hypothetical protein [Brumimicrobium aurantiacum]|uniref:Uncharacterized protein n=1 Tax=Brumimicrobium aurantiacum TaxID=1737063 RepID=A0A3E1EX68_9FLAO|nr:hypothetical protein [Brumimicrobium aurantiacum]RFC54073.1 hypothetical protein DXU93_08770 [Brumimicrobium aurantiacum]
MKYILFVAVFLIINVQFSFAQGRVDGFYKGKGNIELAIGGGVEFASHYFAGTDKISLSREIYYSSLTVASGITDCFDIYLNIPYVMIGNESSI